MRHNLFTTFAALPLLGMLVTMPATAVPANPSPAATSAPAANGETPAAPAEKPAAPADNVDKPSAPADTPAANGKTGAPSGQPAAPADKQAAPADEPAQPAEPADKAATPAEKSADKTSKSPEKTAERHGRTALDVRLDIGDLIGQRALLSASLGSAILGNRKNDIGAAQRALERNASDLAAVVGSAWSDTDRKTLVDNLAAESRAIADYATALLKQDNAARDRASSAWQTAVSQRASLWGARAGGGNVLAAMQEQAASERAVLDHQAVGEIANEYSALQKAYEQSQPVAEFLSGALIRGGSGEMRQVEDSPASTQRIKLHQLLTEHAFLLSNMTADYLSGRTDEYTAVSAILDMNSDRIIAQMTQAFGQEAGNEFSKLWKTHVEHVMDYTKAKEPPDRTVQKRAMNDLAQYAESLTELLHPLPKPNIPMHTKKAKAAAKKPKPKEPAHLLEPQTKYVSDVKSVVDAQASHSSDGAFDALRQLFTQSSSVADSISSAADSRPVSTP
jgi:hypothetical protein